MAVIKHLLKIEAMPELIYEALTTAAGVRNWWTNNADLDEQVGGEGIFRFLYDVLVETKVKILNLQKPVLVNWSVLESFRPEQNGTIISFELRPSGKATLLHFSQEGFVEADDTYALMNTGWAYYLVSLKQYLEKGKGQPSPHVDFNILTL
jgi:uncharacterized protein YndB with AHSA1/START domain